ncbi:MAG: hypothetical protein GAK45_00234 [Pseudomonas citronellolis]|nr:MAG: hypothetical protein GAK45_00234 [Pseudomonas citronellolis]
MIVVKVDPHVLSCSRCGLSPLLVLQPAQRVTAEDLAEHPCKACGHVIDAVELRQLMARAIHEFVARLDATV